MPILQAPPDKADAALEADPLRFENGFFLPFFSSLFRVCAVNRHCFPRPCFSDSLCNPAISQAQNPG
jgi:hypothetical protein